MSASQVSKIQITLQSDYNNALDLSTVLSRIRKSWLNSLANGAGANKASKVFADTRSLSSGGNEDLDLAGSLVDAFGQTLTFTKLKALIIASPTTNTVNLTVTRPASNGVPFLAAAGDALVLTPGGIFVFTNPSAAGVTVTASSGDLINLAAGAADSTYDIVIIGE